MRIISNFKDYYDSGVSYGADQDTVYNRKEEDVKRVLPNVLTGKHVGYYGWRNDPVQYAYWLNDRTNVWQFKVIGFCGKLYPVIKYIVDYKTSYSYYDVESLKKDKENKKTSFDVTSGTNWENFLQNAENFFKYDFSELSKIFQDENVPVFSFELKHESDKNTTNLKHEKIILNPSLKNFEFYKKWEPSTAYQEIYMYVGGVLRQNEKTMINISDKDKIKQHGFDPKYGFRTLPSKD